MGGSIVPVGGHSVLEPLMAGVPVLFGPNMQNSREIVDEALLLGLCATVNDAESAANAFGWT